MSPDEAQADLSQLLTKLEKIAVRDYGLLSHRLQLCYRMSFVVRPSLQQCSLPYSWPFTKSSGFMLDRKHLGLKALNMK